MTSDARHRHHDPALRVALGYAILGSLWIAFSDAAVIKLVSDANTLASLQTYKGWIFILVTSALLYLLVRSQTKQAEAALSREHELSEAILETIGALVVVVDREGAIVRFNRACRQLTGYSMDEVRGRRVWDFLLSPDEVEPAKAIFNELREGRFAHAQENHWITKRRERRLIDWSHAMVRGEAGDVVYVIGTGIDISARKRAEEELKRQSALFEAVFNDVPDALVISNTEREIVMCNPAVTRVFGYIREELVGQKTARLYESQADYEGQRRTRFKPTAQENLQPYVVNYRRKSGAVFAGETVGTAVKDRDGNVRGYLRLIRDITGRQQAQDRLRESEARMRAIVDNAAEGIITIDERGIIQTINLAAETIFGYDAHEVMGQNVSVLMPSPYRERHDTYIEDYLRTGERKIIGIGREVEGRRKDGSVFPLDLAVGEFFLGNQRFFTGIVQDITDRERAEEELRLTFQSAPTGIVTTRLDGKILSANETLTAMLGYSESELRGMSFMDITYPEDLKQDVEYIRWTHDTDLSTLAVQKRLVHKDGGLVPVSMHSSVAHDTDGRARMLITHIVDRTDLATMEAQMREQRERLAHVARLSTMGEMAAGIAHEVNQPLTAIYSYAQAGVRRVKSGTIDADKLGELLAKISKASLRAGEVVRRLRLMVKARSSQRELADINALVKDIVKLAEVDIRALEFEVELVLSPSLPKVAVDPVQVQQVVLNLIRNGIDAAAGCAEEDKVIRITTSIAADAMVAVAVTDRGTGLTEEAAQQLFNPFFTTKKSGMGMGLAISESIITSHRGRLWFTHNTDRGVTFHFTLPAVSGGDDERADGIRGG